MNVWNKVIIVSVLFPFISMLGPKQERLGALLRTSGAPGAQRAPAEAREEWLRGAEAGALGGVVGAPQEARGCQHASPRASPPSARGPAAPSPPPPAGGPGARRQRGHRCQGPARPCRVAGPPLCGVRHRRAAFPQSLPPNLPENQPAPRGRCLTAERGHALNVHRGKF